MLILLYKEKFASMADLITIIGAIIGLITMNSPILGQVDDSSSVKVHTNLGGIVVYQRIVDNDNTPVIFLHGLFFDHHLWDYHANSIKDRSVYVIDMPMHGNSINVNRNWDLQDCAKMLIEILDELKISQTHAVGHSWGGMTILRAAEISPEKFKSLTFFNTPFKEYSKKNKRIVKLQHLGLIFKNLFIKKAAENVFDAASLKRNSDLFKYFNSCMQKLPNKNIKYLNRVVRINAADKLKQIQNLKISHQIIVGKSDKIAPAPISENIIYEEGGHTTPLEYPENSLKHILSIIQ